MAHFLNGVTFAVTFHMITLLAQLGDAFTCIRLPMLNLFPQTAHAHTAVIYNAGPGQCIGHAGVPTLLPVILYYTFIRLGRGGWIEACGRTDSVSHRSGPDGAPETHASSFTCSFFFPTLLICLQHFLSVHISIFFRLLQINERSQSMQS